MAKELTIQKTAEVEAIKNRIYEVRGLRVMLDRDLAELYEVEVSQLKRQVRRNIERFSEDYMFEFTPEEQNALRCQNGTIKNGRGQHSKYLSYAFVKLGINSGEDGYVGRKEKYSTVEN